MWYEYQWDKSLSKLQFVLVNHYRSKSSTCTRSLGLHRVAGMAPTVTSVKLFTEQQARAPTITSVKPFKRRNQRYNLLVYKLEALKSLCRSPWSMCIHVLNKGHRWIHDKLVFWWWWGVCRSYFTEHTCYLQFSLSIINLVL